MLEVSLRALEEATVQQDGTAWQANVFDGATRANVCKSNMSQNQAAFAEYQADFSAPDLPGENLQDEPPAEDSFEQWVESGCVLSAPGPDWKDLLAEQAQKEVAASAYAHGSTTLADDTNVEESRNSTGRRSLRKRNGLQWPAESNHGWLEESPQESQQEDFLSQLASSEADKKQKVVAKRAETTPSGNLLAGWSITLSRFPTKGHQRPWLPAWRRKNWRGSPKAQGHVLGMEVAQWFVLNLDAAVSSGRSTGSIAAVSRRRRAEGRAQVIEVPTERQWIQARPATILTESDLSASGSFPATPATPEAPLLAPARSGAVQFQKCVPAAWDEAEESFATDSGQGQSGTTVSGDDSPAEQKLPPPTEAEGKDGAGGTQAAEPVEPPLVPTVLIPAPEPVLEAPQAPQAPHVPVVRSRVDTSPVGSATPLVKLKTLEDFLQEADEELKVRQRSASGEAADGAASHVAASLCPGEAAQVDPTEQLDDLVEEEDHLEARDSDAKEPEASLEEEPEGPDELPVVKLRPPPLMVECDGDVRPAGRESLPSLPLLSVPDTPLSLAVQVQPRRASSAPPERRKRGRRAKIVPMVISTGLATAPNSQIPSPNAVFPTPLLPRERPQVFRYSPPERGRDRRSKSLAK
ncbi:unnamed protein product [Cladocopium goreaui]|uniref:Uncharacterized protein n=1 Tax=Cladocopium goreaui TaxID=2562237 RepID=A0A9P1CP26_9DINO|nr:unnamed protein product [Cladocopium goreaui]